MRMFHPLNPLDQMVAATYQGEEEVSTPDLIMGGIQTGV
jgi:hypothetical protein